MRLRKGEAEVHEHRVEKNPWELVDARGKVLQEIWYEGPSQVFTDEEILASDERMKAGNNEALAEIEADGFIRYPIFGRGVSGELVEREAWLHPSFEPSCTEGFFEKHGMETNIYVPSYKRAGFAGTMKMLDRFGVKNYYICIDPDQYSTYKEHYPRERLVIRDILFREPELLEPGSSLKRPMNMAGHAPLCNFTLALSRALGEETFTFADDDFVGMAMKAYKKDKIFNPKEEEYDKDNFYRCSDLREEYGFKFQPFWHRLERIARHARNPGFVGLEKFGTVFSLPISFKYGTRVYSFYVTKNATQVDHIGFQNNDVITSIELSKHGFVNLIQEGICYNSGATQTAGGQTEMYSKFGTLEKGKVLVRMQPNFTKIIDRYSRVHHNGDYNNYNQLRLVGAPLPEEVHPGDLGNPLYPEGEEPQEAATDFPRVTKVPQLTEEEKRAIAEGARRRRHRTNEGK